MEWIGWYALGFYDSYSTCGAKRVTDSLSSFVYKKKAEDDT